MQSSPKKPLPDQIFGKSPQIWRCCWPHAHRSWQLAEMPGTGRQVNTGSYRILRDLSDLVCYWSSPLGRGQDWNADPQHLHTATGARRTFLNDVDVRNAREALWEHRPPPTSIRNPSKGRPWSLGGLKSLQNPGVHQIIKNHAFLVPLLTFPEDFIQICS